MALPSEFWVKNRFGVCGGVEPAFMSTTTEQDVAMGYASGIRGATGIVFEIQQGMVDRGADIGWLSQYPHEAEVLFAPLAGLEVQSSRIDGEVVVLEIRLSINLSSATMDQVIAKRHKLLCEMADNLVLEARQITNEARANGTLLFSLVSSVMHPPITSDDDDLGTEYNDDSRFEHQVRRALTVRQAVVHENALLEVLMGLVPRELAQYVLLLTPLIDTARHPAHRDAYKREDL
eukprot:3026952-Prymnesium_polylepis.1